MSTPPSDPVDRGLVFILTRPLTLFLRVEARSSVLLLSATVIALAWANSPWLASYEVLWTTNLSVRVGEAELARDLRHWVNDGLMTLFFLVMGLELTRELKLYERRTGQPRSCPRRQHLVAWPFQAWCTWPSTPPAQPPAVGRL